MQLAQPGTPFSELLQLRVGGKPIFALYTRDCLLLWKRLKKAGETLWKDGRRGTEASHGKIRCNPIEKFKGAPAQTAEENRPELISPRVPAPPHPYIQRACAAVACAGALEADHQWAQL